MTEEKIATTKGFCVVALTRHLMDIYQIPLESAYEKLLETELYPLLIDSDTGLFMETNDYLCRACDIEQNEGKKALYFYINDET